VVTPDRIPILPRDSQPEKFMAALNETFDTYWQKVSGSISAFEVSGGLDSATMPQYLATVRGTRVVMAVLQYNGAYGASQQIKLNDLRQTSGSDLVMVPLAQNDIPLSAHFNRGYEPFYQYTEIYAQSFERLISQLKTRGTQVIFRGIGGDELHEDLAYPPPPPQIPNYILYDSGRAHLAALQEALPTTLGSPTVYGAKLSANKQYIDHDIWPIFPLGDPLLYRFSQNLPLIYRGKKSILRKYHEAYGFAESVFRPTQNENFSPFFTEVTSKSLRPHLEELMNKSLLYELKLIDPQAILHDLPAALARRDGDELFALYRLVTAELILQSVADKLQLTL